MSDIATTLLSRMRANRSGFFTSQVAYSRGLTIIGNITATVGRTPYEVEEGGVLMSYESRDYLIAKSDLVASGQQLTPQSGDRITESDGRVYEVSMPKPLFVYESIGPDGLVFKIHTKAVVK